MSHRPGPWLRRPWADVRRGGTGPALTLTLALALATACSPAAAGVCIGSGEVALDAIELRIAEAPERALPLIAKASAAARHGNPEQRAWLRALQNLALGMAGREDPTLEQDIAALQTVMAPGQPALLRLRLAAVDGMGQREAALAALAALVPQVQALPAAAPSRVCALAMLAHLQLRWGQHAEAFESAAQATRESAHGGASLAWASAVGKLAHIVRLQGDQAYSTSLSTDAIAYLASRQLHDRVSDELSMRGWSRMDIDPAGALVDLRGAEAAARLADNRIAIARARSGLCHLLVVLGRLPEAAEPCRTAYEDFRRYGDLGELWTPLFMAGYHLKAGELGAAMRLLDEVLHDGAGQSERLVRMAHTLRAEALARLGDHRGAYRDLSAAHAALLALDRTERQRGEAIARARFRSEQLVQELDLKTAQHARSVRTNWLIGGLAALCVALSSAIALVVARHRSTYERLAYTDALTGAANRRFAQARLEQMLAHALARGDRLTIAILDLDHFKACNDRWGHAAGDSALQALAEGARRLLRPGDLFARWGGEEFLLALPGSAVEPTAAVVERLRHVMGQVHLDEAPGYRIAFSAGIAAADGPAQDLGDLLRRADLALYQAKAGGRGRSAIAAATAPDAG